MPPPWRSGFSPAPARTPSPDSRARGPSRCRPRGARRSSRAGTWAGVDVLHISRHGAGHPRLSNHVTHRANIAALKALGASGVLAVTVCGAVDPGVELGSLVCFDDLHFLANRLPDGSLCTFFTEPGARERGHWIYEGPFSSGLRGALLAGASEAGVAVRDGGCYGHVDGPRFNTRAEIRGLAACGVTAVSQTAGPETVLCGEAELPVRAARLPDRLRQRRPGRGDAGRDPGRDDGRLHRGVRDRPAGRAPARGRRRAAPAGIVYRFAPPSGVAICADRTVVSAWPEMRKSSSRKASPRVRPMRRPTPSKRAVALT